MFKWQIIYYVYFIIKKIKRKISAYLIIETHPRIVISIEAQKYKSLMN